MQRAVLEHDWATTALGAEDTWSPTLRTAASTALNSQFGMLLMWGPELVMIYNDAYAPALGNRHPGALGRRVEDVWVDVWADIVAMIDEVFAGGTTYFEDLPLTMTRHGFEEECYFTFSYSPIAEPGGKVVALLNTVVETTQRMLAARRLVVLQRLGSLPRSVHGGPAQAAAAALAVLEDARTDCPFGLVYLGEEARPVAAHGLALDAEALGDAFVEHVRTAVATGETRTVTGLDQVLPGLSVHGASPAGQADVHTAVVLPLTIAGQSAPAGALVLGTSPHLWLDDEYRTFLSLTAGQVAAAVGDARAVEFERRRGLPSTTSRRPARSRWVATGMTSSTSPRGATAWSWATSSARGCPPRRSWASSAAPGGRCCWRAAPRPTCSPPSTGSPPSSPARP
jgi:hypothetical protein